MKAKRKFLAVTMRPELVEEAFAEASKRDMPLTAWVREVVVAELDRLRETA